MIVQLATLKGHKKSINCISSFEDKIATGSSDNLVRLWDSSFSRCVKSFFPPKNDGGVAAVLLTVDKLYCSVGSSLITFDTRSEKMLETNYLGTAVGSDDINSIVEADTNYLAVGSDDGCIYIVHKENKFSPRMLSGGHTSLIGSVAVRGSLSGKKQLASGGYDCNCCIWNYEYSELKSTINFSTLPSSQCQSQPASIQMLNPPFVQSVGYMHNGRTLACALGDGSIKLFDANMSSKSPFQELNEAHNGMITCAYTADRYLITGGKRTAHILLLLCCLILYAYTVTPGIDRSVRVWGSSSSALHPQKSEPPASAVEQSSEAEVEKGQNYEGNDGDSENDSDGGKEGDSKALDINNNNSNMTKTTSTHNKKPKKKAGTGKGKAKKKGHRHPSHTYTNNTTNTIYDTSGHNISLLHTITCNEKVNVVHALHDVASVDCPSTVLVADAVSSDVYVYTVR